MNTARNTLSPCFNELMLKLQKAAGTKGAAETDKSQQEESAGDKAVSEVIWHSNMFEDTQTCSGIRHTNMSNSTCSGIRPY